jgi:hypothetical protein
LYLISFEFRLLLDIKSLQNLAVLGNKVPRELLNNIQGQLVSSIVASSKDIMASKDQTALIKKLEFQAEELYKTIGGNNKYFWLALLRYGSYLTARPEYYSTVTVEDMQMTLQFSYASWRETSRAIDMIRGMTKKQR